MIEKNSKWYTRISFKLILSFIVALFFTTITLVLFWQTDTGKIFYYDIIKNNSCVHILQDDGSEETNGEWLDGLYSLESCYIGRGSENRGAIIRLKDTKTGYVYKKGYDSYIVMPPIFLDNSIMTGATKDSVVFCIPRKDDLQKEIIEKRVGITFEDFYKKMSKEHELSNCI